MTNDNTNPAAGQKTLRLTDYQALTVALAQRIFNQLDPEGQALIQQGQAKQKEASATLRAAVEGAFREHGTTEMPTAEVKIVNDERGRPAVLVWTEAPKADAPAAETADDEEVLADSAEEKAVEEKPKASLVPGPVNGKHPEAAKRKLPVK